MRTNSHSSFGRVIATALLILVMGCAAAFAQTIPVKGTVLDTNGEPIIGATIMVVGTNNGVSSDLDGKFTINVKPGSILSVRYVGCKPQNIQVKNDKPLSIIL